MERHLEIHRGLMTADIEFDSLRALDWFRAEVSGKGNYANQRRAVPRKAKRV